MKVHTEVHSGNRLGNPKFNVCTFSMITDVDTDIDMDMDMDMDTDMDTDMNSDMDPDMDCRTWL